MMNDLQMARGEVEGGFNLGIGEPVVVQQRLNLPMAQVALGYPYPSMEPLPVLKQELRHMYPSGEIVVANGAKQALAAALYALKRVDKKTHATALAPYWPSHPTLAKLVGLEWGTGSLPSFKHDHLISVVTSPNNPDGRECVGYCDIWDAVYASALYGWSGECLKARVTVSSASKLYGLTGARVGWLFTKEPRLAEAARAYIEITTSGVSLPAQVAVATALRWGRKTPTSIIGFVAAQNDMKINGATFMRILGKHCASAKGLPATGKGMFAYFRPKDPDAFDNALKLANVHLVNGLACGGRSDEWRMNMAHDLAYTERALKAIGAYL